MPLRSRPDGSAAASRMAALMPVQDGGWVPPEEPSWAGGWPEAAVGGAGSRSATASGALPPAAAVPVVDERPARDEVLTADGSPARAAPEVPTPDRQPTPSALVAAAEAQQSDAAGRSWSARQPGAHVAATSRYRLDPGRRGAVALVLTALLAAVVAGGVALRNRPQEVPLPVVEAVGVPLPGASAPPPAGAEVVVAVSGKVRKPGLIRLPTGSRVDDAVRAAGGPLPGADVGMLNVARRLVDGEQVLVGVAAPAGAAPGAAAQPGGLLDLNAASASDLDALPGIGPVLAQRIVDWRTENGRFASVDQLREVTGIGEAKYSDLQAKVTV